MAAPLVTTPARQHTMSEYVTILVASVLAVAACIGIVALVEWSPWSADDAPAVQSQYGAGYPLHGGLAGPSRLSVWDQQQSYGAGYPLHGGLAGPSRLSVWDQQQSYGAGYPLHGGLAGPSRLSVWDQAQSYGAGYPLHGGLAGPSQVDGER